MKNPTYLVVREVRDGAFDELRRFSSDSCYMHEGKMFVVSNGNGPTEVRFGQMVVNDGAGNFTVEEVQNREAGADEIPVDRSAEKQADGASE